MRASYPPMWDSLRSERFDPLGVWHRVGGDMRLLREVIQTFATESAQMLRNIEQAIQQNDVAALHNAVHRLRGSLLQLAAPAASAAAADLETSVLCASKGEVAHSLEKLRAEIDSLMRALVSMASEVAAEFGQAARVY